MSWLADIVDAFQHLSGLPARARVLRFFAIGDVTWAALVLLAVALVIIGGRGRGSAGAAPSPVARLGAAAIAGASAVVAVSAVVAAITALTLAGEHAAPGSQIAYAAIGLPVGPDQAFHAALLSLAAVPVAAAACWWALGIIRPSAKR